MSMFKDIFSLFKILTYPTYPFPGFIFEKGSNDSVEGMDVPGLIHKVDPSKSGRKTVLLEAKTGIQKNN